MSSHRSPIILGIALALAASSGCGSYDLTRNGIPPARPAGLTGGGSDEPGARLLTDSRRPDGPADPESTRAPEREAYDPDRDDEQVTMEAADASPATPSPGRVASGEPPDPGAARILGSMLAAIDDPQQGEDGLTRIGLSSVRNQSRSSREQFTAMRRLVMTHLTRAGRGRRIVFTDAEEVPLQYRLEGTAYRLDGDGAARWELYLRLQREDDGTLVWECDGPVHVRVNAGPGQSRITVERE